MLVEDLVGVMVLGELCTSSRDFEDDKRINRPLPIIHIGDSSYKSCLRRSRQFFFFFFFFFGVGAVQVKVLSGSKELRPKCFR